MRLSSIAPDNELLQSTVVKAFRSLALEGSSRILAILTLTDSNKQKIFEEGGVHLMNNILKTQLPNKSLKYTHKKSRFLNETAFLL